MRILLTGPVPPHPGGGAISRGQLLAGFVRAGHEVCVLAPITERDLLAGDRFSAGHPRLNVVRYVLDTFEKQPFRPPPAEFLEQERRRIEARFPSLVESFRPDLVVVGRETFARYVPQLVARFGLPSVLLVRGSPTGHILRGEYPAEETRLLLAEFRRADRIIAVSQNMADGLAARGFDNVVHIPNAIDVDDFTPQPPSVNLRRELDLPPGHQVVLAPANLHQRKRPFDVVASAEIALRENRNLVYVMAGTGVLRDEVRRLVESKGMASSFRFPGWVDYSRMPALMNLADVVVMASEAEGMARAYLEAMACQRPLLASDIPPARELIEDGVTGLLFPLGNAVDLAAWTLRVAGDPELRVRLGRQARESVRDRSVDRVVPLYLAEFDEVVGKAAPRRAALGGSSA